MNWYWRHAASPDTHETQSDNGRSYSPEEWGVDQAYAAYKRSYDKATGKSWAPEKFKQESAGWTFYGDKARTGYITIKQQGQFIKITTMGGLPRGAVVGLQKLLSENKPVWAMASQQVATFFSRFGLVVVQPESSKCVLNRVYPFSFSSPVSVQPDGAAVLNYADLGPATKYLLANQPMLQYIQSVGC